MLDEQLVMVLHPEPGQTASNGLLADLAARNQKLLPYKRISGYLVWEDDFPRTASLKIKRGVWPSRFAGGWSAIACCLYERPCEQEQQFSRHCEPGSGGGPLRQTSQARRSRSLRAAGLDLEVAPHVEARRSNDSGARCLRAGQRNFLAVGRRRHSSRNHSTAYFPPPQRASGPASVFLPLGTGNSFLRDFQ